jgi:hypothetical protein
MTQSAPLQSQKSIIFEVIMTLNTLNALSRTFRVHVQNTSENISVGDILLRNEAEIVSAHNGIVTPEDIKSVALGLLEVEKSLKILPLDDGEEVASPLKLQLHPGCTLDLYVFAHAAYHATGR